jgi:hypothetical protein
VASTLQENAGGRPEVEKSCRERKRDFIRQKIAERTARQKHKEQSKTEEQKTVDSSAKGQAHQEVQSNKPRPSKNHSHTPGNPTSVPQYRSENRFNGHAQPYRVRNTNSNHGNGRKSRRGQHNGCRPESVEHVLNMSYGPPPIVYMNGLIYHGIWDINGCPLYWVAGPYPQVNQTEPMWCPVAPLYPRWDAQSQGLSDFVASPQPPEVSGGNYDIRNVATQDRGHPIQLNIAIGRNERNAAAHDSAEALISRIVEKEKVDDCSIESELCDEGPMSFRFPTEESARLPDRGLSRAKTFPMERTSSGSSVRLSSWSKHVVHC